jgi:hypothetical protein
MKKQSITLAARTVTPLLNSADGLYDQIQAVLQQARRQAKRSVNQAMVLAYWQVGKLIVEHEQGGEDRAAYGAKTLQLLADRLTADFGKGFAVQSLRNYRQFYLSIAAEVIRSTPWSELGWSHIKVLSHQDVGQLDMYVRVFDEQVRQTGDNPTIGLILCSERNEAVARYSLLNDSEQIFANRYQPWLPTEAELQAELTRDRALLESARVAQA